MSWRLTRRTWLQSQVGTLAALAGRPKRWSMGLHSAVPGLAAHRMRAAMQTERLDLGPWQVLAQQAVDAARTVGAQYADARLTRTVGQGYSFAGAQLIGSEEFIGVGVRALVDGYWGFSGGTLAASDEVVRLARDAVVQAKENAKGPPSTVELGAIPAATGSWATPCRIDPFAMPLEEKEDFMAYWKQSATEAGVPFYYNGIPSWLRCARQERVLATSQGSLVTQTVYETGALIILNLASTAGGIIGAVQGLVGGGGGPTQAVPGIGMAGAGWERLLDAKLVDQFPRIRAELQRKNAIGSKPSTVGKYTLVCDGATMAALLEDTFGVATQLDRALGYEANASGTSFITDPLGTIGHLQVASPRVTITGNRSAPQELATVHWDDEGVVPEPFTLIKDGVLVDFQTTREQAAWLAPYYKEQSRPVASHGCAAAENAHLITSQMMPNLALEPGDPAVRLEDLVANVPNGILIEGGTVMESDSQARTGLLQGEMREIKNGRLGKWLLGGTVLFESQDLWKHVMAIGGPSTQEVVGWTAYGIQEGPDINETYFSYLRHGKGQPSQLTSHSARAVAATIADQPVIDPLRKT